MRTVASVPAIGLDCLAAFGAPPRFAQTLHVGRPNIGERAAFLRRMNDILDRRWLTNNGYYVREFESRIAELLGVDHCVAMSNATVALEIVTRALGMAGEVIVPSMTFVATAHALQWQRITPVFCDIDPLTHHIDPTRIEALITPRTTGIVGVHLWGRACDTKSLHAIAEKHDLRLVFDAAHALGCTRQGRMVGTFGDAEVLSFHATKLVNSFEGGAIVTSDEDLAARVRLMKNFGFVGMDSVEHEGTNGKMCEASAAMGITSLEAMEEFVERNRSNYEVYRKRLIGLPGIRLLEYPQAEHNNFQYIVIEVDRNWAGLSRDSLMWVLHAENVRARRYFYPGCHRMEPYRSYFPHAHLLLGQTESVLEEILVLPTGSALTPQDVNAVCDVIETALSMAPAVERHLAHCVRDSAPSEGPMKPQANTSIHHA